MSNPRVSRAVCSPLVAAALLVACSHSDKQPQRPDDEPYLSTSYAKDTGDAPDGDAAPDADETPTSGTPSDTPANTVEGPGGIPLPADAVARTDMPSAGGKMSVHEITRDRHSAEQELRANLAAAGWVIDAEEVSPRFGALRLDVSKGDVHVNVRLTGDDAKSAIIITLK
ncbi:MAG: hypothetical protein IPH07_32660 [Deltaproteobacteria bacterium]|nr:hypothetical protein [Deltaproteobacteria bacterium]MBK8716753.1 hypothetical protein [Deltaproteobacteria bacterium]MBP7285280.1 hypothetical protein [Nannocystaceae bacterium]